MVLTIIDRGRGPEIAGTRITVYSILDYLRDGWHHSAIAAEFGLTSEQVLAAMRYVEEHQQEVMAEYQAILNNPGVNPPEIEAKLVQSRAKLQAEMERLRQRKQERVNGTGALGG